uniref:NYN domain-containing protein n=1 Tax=Acidobacterium capsulatum TaxID=33075 RepID=A0A7V4XUQ0_9BACT
MPTAILIDGGYFLKRFPSCYPGRDRRDPALVARTAFEISLSHLKEVFGRRDSGTETILTRELHRIFFYDCPPLQKRAHYPVSRRPVDFSKTAEATFRLGLHQELRKTRKMALRLGHLADHGEWQLRPGILKSILGGSRQFSDLKDDDFTYEAKQKGVDMRIGIDIAALAYKKQVDQIVLLAGDADFVPAAKLARREGIDFILDPMWRDIHESLSEHVDGVRSTCPRPVQARE